MQDRSDFPEEIFGFHAQQVIEKSLKAWLTALHLVYPKSHDVGRLTQLLERSGADLSRFPGLDRYTVFAVQYRYEAYDAADEGLDRGAIVGFTNDLLGHVRQVVTEP